MEEKISAEVYPRKLYLNYIHMINTKISMIVDIIDILPKFNKFNGSCLQINCHNKNVIISWVNKSKRGYILNKQNQPVPLTVPRHININENWGEILGLYFGDGTKNNPSCVELSNFCPELIKQWVTHLGQFYIKVEDLSFNVKVSENVKIKYKIDEKEIEEYWKKILKLPTQKEISINWVKTKGKPSSYLQKYGTCVVRYFNTAFSIFYNAIMDGIPKFLEFDEKFRIGFIRGIIASDGNINIRRNGSLSLVRIAGDEKERSFISKILLRFFGILAMEDKNNQIYFGNIDNLRKIKQSNLHSMHTDKKIKFEQGYEKLLNNLNRRHDVNSVLKNDTALLILEKLEKCPLKTKEIISYFKISREWVRDIFNGYRRGQRYKYNGLEDLGLVHCKRNSKNRCEKIWSITKKGEMFLKNLDQK